MSEGGRALGFTVTGRVQGVGYRAFAQTEATGLGIRGWICNRPDGSVEAAVSGPGPALAELIGRLRRGPAAARVDGLEVRSIDHGAVDEPPEAAYAF